MRKTLRCALVLMSAIVAQSALCQDTFEDDFKTVQEIARAYGNAWNMPDDKFEDFLKLCKERDSNIRICQDVWAKYKSDVEAKNDRGRRMETLFGHTKAQFQMFMSSATRFAEEFPAKVKNKYEVAEQRMQMAESSKSWPLVQSARRELEFVKGWCRVIQAFNGDEDPTAKETLAKVKELDESYAKKEAAFKKASVREVKMPVEGYKGGDKETHRSAIKKAWQSAYPSDKILKIVFPEGWDRKSEWNHNGNGNYSKSDMSYLVAWVIVQKDAKTAMMYPAYVNKNNLSGKISYGVQTKGGQFVNDEIALSKVK